MPYKTYKERKEISHQNSEAKKAAQTAALKIMSHIFDFESKKGIYLHFTNFPSHIGCDVAHSYHTLLKSKSCHPNLALAVIGFIDKQENTELKQSLEEKLKDDLIVFRNYFRNKTQEKENTYTDNMLSKEQREADAIIRPIIELLLKELNIKPTQLQSRLAEHGSRAGNMSGYVNRYLTKRDSAPMLFPRTLYGALLTIMTEENWLTKEPHLSHYNKLKQLILSHGIDFRKKRKKEEANDNSDDLSTKNQQEDQIETPEKKQCVETIQRVASGDYNMQALIQNFNLFGQSVLNQTSAPQDMLFIDPLADNLKLN